MSLDYGVVSSAIEKYLSVRGVHPAIGSLLVGRYFAQSLRTIDESIRDLSNCLLSVGMAEDTSNLGKQFTSAPKVQCSSKPKYVNDPDYGKCVGLSNESTEQCVGSKQEAPVLQDMEGGSRQQINFDYTFLRGFGTNDLIEEIERRGNVKLKYDLLHGFEIKDLVEELKRRDGVRMRRVYPYYDKLTATFEGPAIILEVAD